MNSNHATASQTLLQRIPELRGSGRTPREITAKIFTPEPEAAEFRLEALIEIILANANRYAEDQNE